MNVPPVLTRVFHVILLLFMVTSIAFTAWLTYLRVFDGNPPAVYALPFRTEKQQYARGEYLTLTARVCKKNRYAVTVYPSLVRLPDVETDPPVEGTYYRLPTVVTPGTPADCGSRRVTNLFQIPKEIPPGRYFLKATSSYHVNFLVDRPVDWYTNHFIVTP